MKSLHRLKSHKHINEAFRGEAFILDCLACCKRNLHPGEIGQEMEVSSARIASALNRLEKKELITRQIDTQDRRGILIEITPKGREVAEENRQMILRFAADMLERLGEDDAREYVRIQKRLATILPECKEF
jgi:DNA-binding MarR family transcriptional regulator